MRVLLLCSGNTCRSPMAAGILGVLAPRKGYQVEVKTAGLWAQEGESLAKNAVAAMEELNVDISHDYPKQLTRDLVEWADIIVPIDERYGDEIAERFPQARQKLQPLTRDIFDPYGGELTKYRECRNLLQTAIEELLPRLPIK